MAKILVVDDDQVLCEMFTDRLERKGHETDFALTLAEARQKSQSDEFDIIFLDVQLPDGNGLNALPDFKSAAYSPEVIIITGKGDPDGAEVSVKSGAWAYLEKSTAVKEMLLPLNRALEYRKEKLKAKQFEIRLKSRNIIGQSPVILDCVKLLSKAAASDANILISGETGVGKELFAREIHDNSPRSNNNFVIVDCAALPENLVESILFGYEKGAFTGAEMASSGLIKQAEGGSLFLDEIGELNLSIQKKFLRALQERKFRPIGGKKEVRSNFRLIAATNRSLETMVQNKRFREDLFYRLKTMSIDIPPLKKRPEDIKALAIYKLNELSQQYNIEEKGFAPDFFESLCSYSWPGNVRELFNTIEVILNNALHEPILYTKHLPENLRINLARSSVKASKEIRNLGSDNDLSQNKEIPSGEIPEFREYRATILDKAEKEYLQRLMQLSKGSIKDACQIAGLGRTRLHILLKKHNISRLGWFS